MSVTAAMIAGVISAAETAFPGAVLTMWYGDNREHRVQAFRSDTVRNDGANDLGGVEPGQRGQLRLILSRCGDNTPPETGDVVLLQTSAGVDIGTVTILSHNDDPTSTVRTLFYGEESA